jgi:transcriptional regulator with XRE-family HTH domain
VGFGYEPELIALGRAVRQIREQRDMSMSELAGAVGVQQRCVEELEAGQFDPPFDVLVALAKGLGVGGVEFMAVVEELDMAVRAGEGQVQL